METRSLKSRCQPGCALSEFSTEDSLLAFPCFLAVQSLPVLDLEPHHSDSACFHTGSSLCVSLCVNLQPSILFSYKGGGQYPPLQYDFILIA